MSKAVKTESKKVPEAMLSMLKRAQMAANEAKKREFIASASFQELLNNIAQELKVPEGASIDMETGEIVEAVK